MTVVPSMNSLATSRIIGTWCVGGMLAAVLVFAALLAPNLVRDPAELLHHVADPEGYKPILFVMVYGGLPLGLFLGLVAARRAQRATASKKP